MTGPTEISAVVPAVPFDGAVKGQSGSVTLRTLEECEAVIERGLATFIEVGQALLEIRDSRLYRESHGTFESYCLDRWGFTPQHGGRLIAAAEVAGILEPIGSSPPNEAVARELAPLKNDPDAMREALAEASEDGPPTAAKVREAVQRKKVSEPKPEPTSVQGPNGADAVVNWSRPAPVRRKRGTT